MAFLGLSCDDPRMMAWLWILIGLVVLTAGAELLVRGSAWIAEALGVRHMIVGLTVVAIGTSAPELVVSLIGATENKIGLVLGNVYGSNIANIAMILGITALIAPIAIKESKIRFELIWLLAATACTVLSLFTESYGIALGAVMITGIVAFICSLVQRERKARPTRTERPPDRSANQLAAHLAMVPAGLTGLIFGGKWLVGGAVTVATDLGMSEAVIGATIVAIGTSLPELATAIVAARKGHSELVIGNIIGSNIFNILMVIGVTATIVPLPVSWAEQGMRTMFGLGLTILLAVALLGPKRLPRPVGVVFLASYVAYLALEIFM